MFQPLTGQLQCRIQCSLKSLVSCALYDLHAKCETGSSLYSRYFQLFHLKFGVPRHTTQLNITETYVCMGLTLSKLRLGKQGLTDCLLKWRTVRAELNPQILFVEILAFEE
jgi:hypothetical protein